MTAAARVPSSAPAPLFVWQNRAEAARLEAIRTALTARIAALPRHSHRRIVLQARLGDITARQLAIETLREDVP